MNINWFPGHMHKAIKDMKRTLPTVDVVIEVLDARIPYSSSNPLVAEMKTKIPSIKLLNKSDLAEPALTQEWLDFFLQDSQTKAIAICCQQSEQIKLLPELAKQLVAPALSKVRTINAMIMGVPNVGKSTLLNALAGRSSAKTGNEAALTKAQQRVNCKGGLVLLDTPGILWPKFYNQQSAYRLAATGAIKNTAVEYEDIALFLIEYLQCHLPNSLAQRFAIDATTDDALDTLRLMGLERGCISKGGGVNYNQISKIIVHEFRAGKFGRISLETPLMMEREEQLVAQLKAQRIAKQKARRGNKKL